MPLVAYLDEIGDHSLESINPQFPLFGVMMLICKEEVYCQQIVPSFYRFKFEHFGHEGVILHSRKIRSAKGDFVILRDSEKRRRFFNGLNRIMSRHQYTLVGMFIDKAKHRAKYGPSAFNPYELAFTFALERLLYILEGAQQEHAQILAESRGKEEDRDLGQSLSGLLDMAQAMSRRIVLGRSNLYCHSTKRRRTSWVTRWPISPPTQ
jgi:hypothetical protein